MKEEEKNEIMMETLGTNGKKNENEINDFFKYYRNEQLEYFLIENKIKINAKEFV